MTYGTKRTVNGVEIVDLPLSCPKCGSTVKGHVDYFTLLCESITPPETWKGYEIRKLKTFKGLDNEGFNADLCKDGKRIAEVVNDGSGGETRFYWTDFQKAGGSTYEAEFLALSEKAFPGREYEQMALLVDNMIDALLTKKKFDRISKKKTLFQVGKEIGSEEWRTLSVPFGDGVKAVLLVRHGDQPIFIYGHGNISRAKGL